jgi:Helicase HerA, central domain/TraM recognition site of TraD and TraG
VKLTPLGLAGVQHVAFLLVLATIGRVLPWDMVDALHRTLLGIGPAINPLPGRHAPFPVAALNDLVTDELFAPWLGSSFVLGSGCAWLVQALWSGLRSVPRYACGLSLSLLLPFIAWWWIAAEVFPVYVTLPSACIGYCFAQLGAWLIVLAPQDKGALHDVHQNAAWLNALKRPYDALAYASKPVFVGLRPARRKAGPSSARKPYSLPAEIFHKNHIAILGATGTGKSKLAGLILAQLHSLGDSAVVFDPKNDEFLPGILAHCSARIGTQFAYIDLRENVAQINPFRDCTSDEMSLLLQSGLQLDPTGDPAVDFYRGADREACALLCSNGARHITDLVTIGQALPSVTGKENFWRQLKSLASIQAFHTEGGPDLAAVIEAGGIVYIAGDTEDLRVVAAQRMLLTRVCQIIKARKREGARQVAMMLDEFKYMLSNSALRALGTIRDRRCNLLLAFQSYGDLEDCGALNPKAVRGAADNCTLNFVYKLLDRRTAEDFVRIAGDDRVMLESCDKDALQRGHWREANRQAVSIDMLTTNAPKPLAGEASVGWVFGLGPAFPLATSHLPGRPAPRIVAAPPIDHARSVRDASYLDPLDLEIGDH